jgi:hypothetical protein
MAPGLRSDGERSELPQLTLADLDPADQDRYRRTDQSNNQAIQLDCDSCHAPFKAMSASAGGGQSLASADDRHMSLPNYNQHCKACHPLDYKPGSPDKLVKHGMSAGELRTFLDEKYPADGPQGNDAFVEPSVAKRPLPGEPPSDAHDEKQRRALQASNRQRAESHLRNRCYECHQPKASGDAVLPDVQEVPWSKSPFTWLREAKFSHKVHAFARIDCQKCHESVETEGDWLAADKAIPDVDVCRECHAGKVDSPNVKAPFDCVTCHRYHRADGTDGHSPIAAVSAAADLERFQDAASLRTQFVALVDPPDANDFVGSISCAAGGCHGGKWNAAGDGDPAADESTWKMSYTTWMRRDPHADAYQALWSERSQRMVALLTARAPAPYEQVLHDRCIGCHSTAQHDDPAQRQWLADGVSCESCHGPAADWGLAHTLENWNPPNDHRDSSPGFVDTRNLEARAEKCVSCHVGQLGVGGIDSGQGGYEVNHDLIAAGHPRLNFEFAAYVENLPPHWNTKREAADHHPLDPNRWVVGQTVAARAALGQLAARAKAAATGESSTSVWPELAEYACDSCHHDLESPSYRQRHRTTAQLGQLTWGAWYFPVFERPGADAAQQPPIEPLSELREAMQAFVPNHGEVAKKCQALTLVDVDAGEATKKLRAAIRGTPRATWDDVAQWYLAAAALVAQLERDDAFAKDGAAAPAAKSENDAALAELHRTLEFPFVGSSARREFEGCYEAVDRLRELLSPWIEEDAAE